MKNGLTAAAILRMSDIGVSSRTGLNHFPKSPRSHRQSMSDHPRSSSCCDTVDLLFEKSSRFCTLTMVLT